jgi:hypothetical protein
MRHIEAHCECGASWSEYLDVGDVDDAVVECVACGATVVDLRDDGEHHSAGRCGALSTGLRATAEDERGLIVQRLRLYESEASPARFAAR